MAQPDLSRAPFHMRYSRKSDFEPKFVSIGPHFHNYGGSLDYMETVKVDFVQYFLEKQRNEYEYDGAIMNLADLVEILKALEEGLGEKIRAWYGEASGADEDALLKQLVADCCFIIRIVIYLSREANNNTLSLRNLDVKLVRIDLLLLENQVPFFFLEKVYNSLKSRDMLPSPSDSYGNLLDELKPFIRLDMPWEFNKNGLSDGEKPKHLLELYWKSCLPDGLIPKRNGKQPADEMNKSWVNIHLRSNAPKRIRNARKLYKTVGVTFEKIKHEKGFGVTFRNGKLKLPHLQLDTSQTTLLANLIAFEDSMRSENRVLTSYILLLDGLINTGKDVELLQHQGIITNKLSSTEMASTFFNDIGNICLVEYDNHYCKQVFDDLNGYYNSCWRRQLAILWHTSCSSPWAVISVIAGTLLLMLAAVQTGYGIARYYKHA